MATTLNRLRSSVSALSHRALFNSTRRESLPSQTPPLRSTTRSFLDFYQFGNKKAIEEERARLNDEMNRGYFADMKEFKEHGGKIADANKTVIPAVSAVKFPELAVTLSNGEVLKLPISCSSGEVNEESLAVPRVSLVCLSFRASSQGMISSWSKPFLESFGDRKDLQVFEVSFIDKWLLGLAPIRKLLLRVLQKPKSNEDSVLQRRVVYSFGDHYHFRKEIKVLNLLTGYIFLLDKSGRIRWQGFGTATPEEVSKLLSCTSQLLEDQ
ncbi:hypothetical protein HID58_036805 [Brassica napus]|uniref:AT1G08220-like protein n=2 Tax=Brassica napus TaxID=3708 RepID=A0ABQ8C8U4_BRANA|nr:mitochondrial ATPase complex subunit ATP10-like isoform X1 [Brassica napus]XP_013716124.1 mitochondrial ATPase complex subunit ATP10-like isoform X1 [Brassica napus]KAH0913484.1 hypothetical protein HID58_036805 [Brassica napus]